MAGGNEELREVMYRVITQMIRDGELVPVYDGDQLVDIKVNSPAGELRSN